MGGFYSVINIHHTIFHSNCIRLKNIAGLFMRQATSLDMIGIVRQIDLNFVVDSALPLLPFFLPQNRQQVVFYFCVLAFWLFRCFRDFPSLSGKNCPMNFAYSAIIPDRKYSSREFDIRVNNRGSDLSGFNTVKVCGNFKEGRD